MSPTFGQRLLTITAECGTSQPAGGRTDERTPPGQVGLVEGRVGERRVWADASKDLAIGAAKLGNKVLKYCPRLMIFVEGTGEYFVEWGQSFKSLAVNNMMAGGGPIRLKNLSKLDLSPHSCGPLLYKVPETVSTFRSALRIRSFLTI